MSRNKKSTPVFCSHCRNKENQENCTGDKESLVCFLKCHGFKAKLLDLDNKKIEIAEKLPTGIISYSFIKANCLAVQVFLGYQGEEND